MIGQPLTRAERDLLAAVHRWCRRSGFHQPDPPGLVDAVTYDGVQIDWGTHVADDGRPILDVRDGRAERTPSLVHVPVAEVQQAVDLLVALRLLPPDFSAAYRIGVADGKTAPWLGPDPVVIR